MDLMCYGVYRGHNILEKLSHLLTFYKPFLYKE